jgi:arginine deiminase
MFSELLQSPASGLAKAPARARPASRPMAEASVDSEYGRLESVLLADPRHLALVPCNSVSVEAQREGHVACADRAARQHAGLVAALRSEDVEVRLAPAEPGLPDLAFTRDTSLATPWGVLGLAPGASHRRREVDAVLDAAAGAGATVLGRIETGLIEGGDVAMLRPGLLAIGISGERTDEAGADALAAIYEAKGWRVIRYRFDPHFLHLDTQFCIVDRGLAMACTDVLAEPFLEQLAALGIELLPVGYKEARRLGCNLLSLGDKRVITTGACSRLDAALACRGYHVIALDLSEFTACGGGVHCLTMPLRRAPG